MMNFSKNKSIVYIIPSLDIGGTEKHLFNLATSISNNYKVEIICLENKGLLSPHLPTRIKLINLGDGGFKFGFLKYSFLINQLWKILKPKKCIIHFFLPKSYLIAGTICILQRKTRLIMSRRSTNYYQKKYLFIKFWENHLHKKMRYILVNSNNLKNQLIFDEGVDIKKIIEIKNGIKKFIFEKKNDYKIKKKNTINEDLTKINIIVCLANLIPYKGHIHLIKSLNILNRSFKKWKLLLIGDGNNKYKLKLQDLIKKYGLQEKIIFKGIQIAPEKILKSAKIGILLSDHEGSSNAIVEYMNCSLPIISTDSGNIREILDNKINGYIVKQRDYEGIANLIQKMLLEKKKSKMMGKNNKKKVNRLFNYKEMINRYEEIYDKI